MATSRPAWAVGPPVERASRSGGSLGSPLSARPSPAVGRSQWSKTKEAKFASPNSLPWKFGAARSKR
eukprot:2922971-Alexandrium_andersonii.AAC.1